MSEFSDELSDKAAKLTKADALDYQPAADMPVTWNTEFDGGSGYVQTPAMEGVVPPVNEEILRHCGYDPDEVVIVGRPLVKKWELGFTTEELVDNGAGKKVKVRTGSDSRWLTSYRFTIASKSRVAHDLDELVQRATHTAKQATGSLWAVFQAGDQQLAKRSRDGSTEEILERYFESVVRVGDLLAKRDDIAGLQISLPGDCVEGNQSQRGANLWLTEMTITEQTRVLRRLMMHTLELLAPMVPAVELDVVNGNHDQAQRIQNTYPGDGWATEQAIAVRDALQLNASAYGHVEVRVPEQWSGHMTVPVGDTVVTVVHGHQWARAGGPMRWWMEQAINNQPPAAAAIIQHGHWHELMLHSNEHRIAIGSPTYDCGSDWFREKHGSTAKRGGLFYTLSQGNIGEMTLV